MNGTKVFITNIVNAGLYIVFARTGAVYFQAEDGIRVLYVTGVQTCALPILHRPPPDRAAWRHREGGEPGRDGGSDLHRHAAAARARARGGRAGDRKSVV